MKKLLLLVLLVGSLFAEMSFDQVQGLIKNKQYTEARIALEVIEKNHPNESIVYYTKAQALAGFGDLIGARNALAKAEALNPKLSYAKPEAITSLKLAIEPRVDLVKTFERADKVNYGVYTFLISFGLILLVLWYFGFRKPKDNGNTKGFNGYDNPVAPVRPNPSSPTRATFEERVVRKTPDLVDEIRERRASRPETFTANYGSYHHDRGYNHRDNTSDTIVAGLAGAALGATVANLMHDDHNDHSTVSKVISAEPITTDYFAKSYEYPEPKVESSWNGSNVVEEDNDWSGSNDSSSDTNSDSWSGSNDSSSDTNSDSWSGSNDSSSDTNSDSWSGSSEG